MITLLPIDEFLLFLTHILIIMNKVFDSMRLHKIITLFVFSLFFILSACTASKDSCAAYAYDDTQKNKNCYLNY